MLVIKQAPHTSEHTSFSRTRRFTMNDRRFLRITAALWLVAFGWSSRVATAQESDADPSEVEASENLEDGDRVRIQAGSDAPNTVKLVPFPEDLEEAPAKPAPKLAVPVEKPKPLQTAGTAEERRAAPPSSFRPRFRTPAIRQAQHMEPTAPAGQSETTAAKARPPVAARSPAADLMPPLQGPAGAAAPSADGKALIQQAFAKSKTATTDVDYTDIIEWCRQARTAGLPTEKEEYASRLMSWAYNRRGETRSAQKRDKEALADFETACELNNQSWRAIHNRGVSYAAEGRVSEALADFDRALQLNAKYATAYFNRAELLYSQGQFQEAIRDYTAAIQLGPADAAMHNGRGHAHYRLRDHELALREYGEALKIDPKSAAVLVNRGDVYSDLGRYAEAAADYRSAVKADGSFGRAYQAAAWLMATCPDQHYRNPTLAINAARRAISLDGEDFRNLETLAAAEANAEQFSEAKATQEQAIAKAPKHELVPAEKRMALYQRELAYRETPHGELAAAGLPSRDRVGPNTYPVQQASAEEAAGGRGVTYPEVQRLPEGQAVPGGPPRAKSGWSFWPQRGAPPSRGQGRPRMLPKTPTHPIGRN
jgi:tetratricopeptide (TPR) repeat protein